MFAYCSNNPIMYIDYSGEAPIFFLLTVVFSVGVFLGAYFSPSSDEIQRDANNHYARNELNNVDLSVNEIITSYDKQSEGADEFHEYTHGTQGEEAIYNNKYLSPNGGHFEIIICEAPGKDPYIVNDPINMGTYNYASNENFLLIYWFDHLFRDVVPYFFYGNTAEDEGGLLKWVLD